MHVPFEGPGYIEEWFNLQGVRLEFLRLYEEVYFPKTEELDFLLIMGGPMNIYDYEKFPYLKAEKEFIASCIRENKKVLGICLGAQLIADVLGQRTFPNTEKEIGWFPVTGNWHLMPNLFVPFHWHGETFELPKGAIHLASSEICLNQAFAFQENVLALQFHLEVQYDLIEGLLKHAESDLTPGDWVQGKQEIQDGLVNAESNRTYLRRILEEFSELHN